jgi:hypothetical protein
MFIDQVNSRIMMFPWANQRGVNKPLLTTINTGPHLVTAVSLLIKVGPFFWAFVSASVRVSVFVSISPSFK